jgi:GNAT superfamily N-acetyltransferase
MDLHIVAATTDDVPVILRLIRALAEYERLAHRVVVTEEMLREAFFGPRPLAEVVIARADDVAVGYAVFFPAFSTFAGAPLMFLEDIFVDKQWRRHCVGQALLSHLAAIAVARGWRRIGWNVLKWNEPALAFYQALGAEPANDWVGYGISGEALEKLAQRAGSQ